MGNCEGCGDKHTTKVVWVKLTSCSCNDDTYSDACDFCLCNRHTGQDCNRPNDFKFDDEMEE